MWLNSLGKMWPTEIGRMFAVEVINLVPNSFGIPVTSAVFWEFGMFRIRMYRLNSWERVFRSAVGLWVSWVWGVGGVGGGGG